MALFFYLEQIKNYYYCKYVCNREAQFQFNYLHPYREGEH